MNDYLRLVWIPDKLCTNKIKYFIIYSNIKIFTNIFNEFITTDKYPFILWQTLDGQVIYKYNTESINTFNNNKNNLDILSKWFEAEKYGISFKIKVAENTFMKIHLNELGRMEFQNQWQEVDQAVISDIHNRYKYIKELIQKINNETKKINIEIPDDSEFQYAFINSI